MLDQYKTDYSLLNNEVFIYKRRVQVARQILSVLKEHLKGKDFQNLTCLEVGTSSGAISFLLSRHFEKIIGIDIDRNASQYWQKYKRKNTFYKLMDATQMDFPDNTFDVVITNQDYEFVNDAQKLMDEIFRVLKPGGVCFFGARNKLTLLEGQYRIPFLAFLPQRVARVYLALLGRKRIFLANYKTYWELLQLCKKFILTDYTIAIIKNPRKFNFKQLQKYEILTRKIPTCLLTTFRWLIPNFIFVLQKPRD